jgi:hypothetical protein
MKRILLSAAALLFVITSMAQQSALLKLNLEKNKLYRLKSVSEQTVTQTVSGNQQTVETEVVYMMSVKVLDMTPDFMVTEVHFDTIITNSNTMGRLSTISSAVEGDMASSETSDIMSCIMNRLSTNALFVKIDFTGKPLEIVNAKMISDMILKDTASITLAEPVASALKEQIAGTVSNNTLLTMISGFTRYLPGKEVAVGDNWEITEQVNSGGMLLSITTSYHLDGIDIKNARITAESNIRAAENAPPIQSAGATVTYDNLSGLSKSEMVIDSSTGLLIENNAKTHITGNLGISGPGFSMQMPMDINGETKIFQIE